MTAIWTRPDQLHIAEDSADPGMMEKMNELRVKIVFVKGDANPEAGEVSIEMGREAKMLVSALNTELDFPTMYLYDTLSEDV